MCNFDFTKDFISQKNHNRKQAGFTLAELLIVVAIIAILVAVSVPIFTTQLEKSRRAVDVDTARSLQSILAAGFADGSIPLEQGRVAAIWVSKHWVKYTINGELNKSGEYSQSLKDYVESSGYKVQSNYVKARRAINNASSSEVDGWKWFCVYIKWNGESGVVSGAGDPNSMSVTNFTGNASFAGASDTAISRAMRGEK